MPDERLEIDITARDDASKVIDPLIKKVDALEADTVTVDLEADTGGADDEVDSFAKKLDKLTASDQIVLLAIKAGAAQTELAELAADIGRLDSSDPTIDVKLGQYAQTSSQLDDLETKIKAIATADPDAGAQLDKARTRLQGLGEDAGKAQGAVHSMAGNAVGDFAATATGVGPLGEAVGQLVEGLAGGEVGMKNLVTAGVGLGGLAAGMLAVNRIMGEFADESKRAAEIRAFRTDQVDAFTKSIREGKDAVTEFVEKAEAAGKLEGVFSWSSLGGENIGPKTKTDLIEPLTEAGITVQQYAEVVTGTADDMARFEAALKASGVSAKDQQVLMSAARSTAEDYADAQEKADRFNRAFGESAADAAKRAESFGAAMAGTALKGAALGTELGRTRDKTKDLENAYRSLTTKFDDESSFLALEDGFAAVRTAMENATTATEDQAGASRDARQATLDQIAAVRDYAAEVLGLPPEQITEILARLDQGDVDGVEADLKELTRTRQVWIDVGVRGLLGAIAGINAGITSLPPGVVGTAAAVPAVSNYYLARPASAVESARAAGRRARINGR